MPSGRRHDAHNVDIVPMSCKYPFISQDGCPTRNPMTYTTCLMRVGLHMTPLFGGRQGRATDKTPY